MAICVFFSVVFRRKTVTIWWMGIPQTESKTEKNQTFRYGVPTKVSYKEYGRFDGTLTLLMDAKLRSKLSYPEGD